MTMKDNLRFGKHKEIREKGYHIMINYDAIEVPYTDAIPDDYEGAMGVPITFLDKYCPEQFEILGACTFRFGNEYGIKTKESYSRGRSKILWRFKQTSVANGQMGN